VNAKRLTPALLVAALAVSGLSGCTREAVNGAPETPPAQVTVAASGDQTHEATVPTLAIVQPSNVVVLGDSYAQGWGLLDADEMRAAHWPGQVNYARTGVATYEMGDQLDTLEAQIAAGFVPEAVMVIVGGNDLDLVSAVGDCLVGSCPNPADVLPRLTELEPNLVTRYQQIDELVNSEQLIAARGGMLAPVLAGNYPHLLSSSGPIVIGPLTISSDNIDRVNRIITELNSSVERAAYAAGGAVRFVDLSTTFDGHRFGDPDPYLAINGHPNAAGYRAILTAFDQALTHYWNLPGMVAPQSGQ